MFPSDFLVHVLGCTAQLRFCQKTHTFSTRLAAYDGEPLWLRAPHQTVAETEGYYEYVFQHKYVRGPKGQVGRYLLVKRFYYSGSITAVSRLSFGLLGGYSTASFLLYL